MSAVKRGELWYASISGAPALTLVEILEVTEKTVRVKWLGAFSGVDSRYRLTGIDFVEQKVKKNESP